MKGSDICCGDSFMSLESLVSELKVGEWTISSFVARQLNVDESALHVEKWLRFSVTTRITTSSFDSGSESSPCSS